MRENLVYNATHVSDEALEEACRAVGLDHFVHTLPNGYDTVLGDTISLSQGQKQQLTIARAMIADKPMLILDEATSSVDTRTEQKLCYRSQAFHNPQCGPDTCHERRRHNRERKSRRAFESKWLLCRPIQQSVQPGSIACASINFAEQYTANKKYRLILYRYMTDVPPYKRGGPSFRTVFLL